MKILTTGVVQRVLPANLVIFFLFFVLTIARTHAPNWQPILRPGGVPNDIHKLRLAHGDTSPHAAIPSLQKPIRYSKSLIRHINEFHGSYFHDFLQLGDPNETKLA